MNFILNRNHKNLKTPETLWTWVEKFNFQKQQQQNHLLLTWVIAYESVCVGSTEKNATDYKSQKALRQKTSRRARGRRKKELDVHIKSRKLVFLNFLPFMSCQTIVVCLANSTIIYCHQFKLKGGLLQTRTTWETGFLIMFFCDAHRIMRRR